MADIIDAGKRHLMQFNPLRNNVHASYPFRLDPEGALRAVHHKELLALHKEYDYQLRDCVRIAYLFGKAFWSLLVRPLAAGERYDSEGGVKITWRVYPASATDEEALEHFSPPCEMPQADYSPTGFWATDEARITRGRSRVLVTQRTWQDI